MNETILVIEDNVDMRENTEEILALANYKVISAANGKEGIESAKANRPDLILCDIMMPEMDGYGVLRILENTEGTVGIPFLFLTAKSEKRDFRKAMDMGADDYLTKPFDGDDLLRVVEARLKKSGLMKKKFTNNMEGLNDFLQRAQSLQEITLLSEYKVAKKIRNKDILFMEGDLPNHLYFIASGKIKTFKTNQDGKEYITEIYKNGDFFGYLSLLDDKNHKESAVAIENSEIVQIPKQDFFQLLYSNNEVAMKFIKLLTNNLSQAEGKLLKLAYDSARKRVAEALLFINQKYQDGKDNEAIHILRENLSSIAGISPESVSRNLSDFREEGLIETLNGTIKIVNIKKLEMIRC
ncbi:MAG: response regulator [Bacteroidetes bacterium]|nr:response regulator [Bacteroidota bacterium]